MRRRAVFGLLVLGLVCAGAGVAFAQIGHHPFAVGASESGVGSPTAFGAFLLGEESRFYRGLTAAVRAARTGPGVLVLVGLSFLYGVFHAAGPGHGKAVITSYLVANELALRRGFFLALLAALLQGLIAVAIVGIAALVFDATAARITSAARMIELAGYVGIVGLGLILVWRKGRALLPVRTRLAAPGPAVFALAEATAATPPQTYSLKRMPGASTGPARFVADDGRLHPADCGCGAHIPDAALLSKPKLDWRTAGMAVVTAGARPCSGAILVLVFALSQGLFLAGVASTFAMSLGTALTTGALAAMAVLAKDLALRATGGDGRRETIGRLLEFAAALAVLIFGLALLAAALAAPAIGG